MREATQVFTLKNGYPTTDIRLDRIPQFDERSRDYQVRTLLKAAAPTKRRRTIRFGPGFDQGQEGACVGFGNTHASQALPHKKGPYDMLIAREWYHGAQQIDPWPGGAYSGASPFYEGSSVLAGVEYGRQKGMWSSYRWVGAGSQTVMQDIIDTLRYVGPIVFGLNWYECPVPGQRVLTSDLRWIPIEKLSIGDELIGFDEAGGRDARLRRSRVTALGTKVLPCVEVVTDKGSLVVSEKHPLVRCDPDKGRSWALAKDLQPGYELAHWVLPYEEDKSWEAGWLAGFFDGEGSLVTKGGPLYAAQSRTANPGVLAYLKALLTSKGFDFTVREGNAPGVEQVRLLKGTLEFLGSIRPPKALGKAHLLWEGRRTYGRRSTRAVVQDVRPIGEEEVVTIGTDTKTLMVEGFLSHNSMFEPDGAGQCHIDMDSGLAGGHCLAGQDAVFFKPSLYHKYKLYIICQQSWGPDHGFVYKGVPGCIFFDLDELEALMHDEGEGAVPLR